MTRDNANHICLHRTGRLYELDMASAILEEHGIPFYRQEENSGGLRFAMPFQPAMGPGLWYAIFVPEAVYDEARELLAGISIEACTNPSVWDFRPKPKVKRGWQIYAWAMVVGIIVFWIIDLLNLLW